MRHRLVYACLPCFLFLIHRKISSALPSADKSKTKQTGVTALKFINPWPERVWSLVKSPIDVKQSIAASHTIVQTIKKKVSGLEKIKVESCLDFRARISRSLFVMAEARLGRFEHNYGFTYMCVQWCTMGSMRSCAKSTICNCRPTHFLFFNSRMVMRVQISRCLYFLSLCAIHNTPSTLLKNGMCKFHNARPASCPSHYSAHSAVWWVLSSLIFALEDFCLISLANFETHVIDYIWLKENLRKRQIS